MSAALLDRVWDGTGEGWRWLRGVILGEWEEDERSLSQVVADALSGFVPGVGSIVTLRDLLAVIVRLARHPEKREDVEEWILLIAMLLPLIATVAGALVAGIGALLGAEVGGFLRTVALFLVKKGGVTLKAMVEFFQAHGYGDAVKALQQLKFSTYKTQLTNSLNEQIDKLIRLTEAFRNRLEAWNPQSLPQWLPGREAAVRALARSGQFIEQLRAVKAKAVEMIPKALIEMDQRLGALLAGDIKGATQVTHSITTGQAAPEVARLEHQPGEASMRNPESPEPGNTRRVAERRVVALAGKREYKFVDETGRPVGAKPYEHGVTQLENPGLEREVWKKVGFPKVKEGWPDMGKEFVPGRYATDYGNFSGYLRAGSIQAGSSISYKRVVSHDVPEMDKGAYYNRELPLDGEDLRAGSAVKESWNKNGQYVELRVPPVGHPVWKKLHALAEDAAGAPLSYREELKYWEGPASSQVYVVDERLATQRYDDFYLAGGKVQQFFDRQQIEVLKEHGFVGERNATNFSDFDPVLGNIVSKSGPCFEVVPLSEAVPGKRS